MSKDAEQGAQVPSVYERLAVPFELSDHAKVPKGGMTQTYAPWTSYVERLNAVLDSAWSFRVIREGFTDTECWVLGEITAVIDGETVTRQQYGCELIVKGQRDTPTTDLLKTAASDAVKKAASLLGVGLYLSIKEEREVIEAAMQEAIRAAAAEKRAEAEERKQQATPTPRPQPAPTSAAAPGSTTSPSAGTRSTTPAAPSTSSTTATPVRSTPRVEAAAKLTGIDAGPPSSEQPFKYADVRERFKAAAEYARLVTVATQTGYQHAEKVKAKQAKDLSDPELEGSIRVLRKWELSQAPEQPEQDVAG